jgi:hypothetical protein
VSAGRVRGRCHLVYALAPAEVSASDANDALNRYIEDTRRGIAVFHDHFTGQPHGGVAVLYVEGEQQERLLEEPGPLAGWQLAVHSLVFALTPVGFAAQTELTLEAYGKTTLDELRAAEQPDPRFWWRKRGREASTSAELGDDAA